MKNRHFSSMQWEPDTPKILSICAPSIDPSRFSNSFYFSITTGILSYSNISIEKSVFCGTFRYIKDRFCSVNQNIDGPENPKSASNIE